MSDTAAMAAFLAARYGEDEAVANRAAECEKLKRIGDERGLDPGDWSWLTDYGQPQPGDIALIDHQVRFDPARVLCEVAAKRARLARYERAMLGDLPEWRAARELLEAAAAILLACLRDDAAVYSDHPGYHARWAPA